MKNQIEIPKAGSLVLFNNKFIDEKFKLVVKSITFYNGTNSLRISYLKIEDIRIHNSYIYFDELEILK